ncbi:amidohydrolase family protein [Actinomadura chibensis]|uniref:Amidohydrolase n=1 Tax=Actinomadura chibensis TaxID=392828 RepID=A0A5D0NDP5_9ACTN|nr:amidohydrolase family protein [Actinomadura chibensis]TYB42443.1 amidohydrolase [Actinomadura chibensis]
MTTDPRVKTLTPQFDRFTDTREMLDHARRQSVEYGLDDYFVVDVDSHREPNAHWREVLEFMENPVMRSNSLATLDARGTMMYVPYPGPGASGVSSQSMFGRVPHQDPQAEAVEGVTRHRDVELSRRAMDSIGIDVQVIFPTSLLGLGMSPLAEGEAQAAYAYNRWMVEAFCAEEPRIKFMPYLPLRSPEMCLRIVREFAGRPGVVGFLVTSIRYSPVHDNAFMRLYAAIEETGLPIAFHAGPTWDDDWMKTMNRFISVHALSFVHCNMVHLTNWIINGLPERFPRLKVIWVESGLAWVPFMMQRLDHEYLKRTSEAPLLTRLPSEYMREMYYTSQPMECDDHDLLEATMTAINAETQLLYASDWPHWDFDLPGSILGIRFLDAKAKRNILGLNAARLFNLTEVPGAV